MTVVNVRNTVLLRFLVQLARNPGMREIMGTGDEPMTEEQQASREALFEEAGLSLGDRQAIRASSYEGIKGNLNNTQTAGNF